MARYARRDASCTAAVCSGVRSAGTSKSTESSRYLAEKSYQSTPGRSRISAGRLASGSPPPRAASTPHSISRPGTDASTITFGSTAAAVGHGLRGTAPSR